MKTLRRSLGISGLVMLAVTVWLGLFITPPDVHQGSLVRLLYIHPPIAWVALYLAFGLASISAFFYLWPRTRSLFWDRLCSASVEVGVVFTILTLVTGSLWGRASWGVFWTWTARLTSTAVLLVLFLGYMAFRRMPMDPVVRAKRCSILALIAALDVPIVLFSVNWWQTLHQTETVFGPSHAIRVHGSMGYTLALGFLAMSVLFAWMVIVRYEIEKLGDQQGSFDFAISLADRRREGDLVTASTKVEP